MAATYDTSLPADRDHVRFLIGDTDTSAALFQDAELDAVLEEETATGKALKYFAAARALGILQARWASAGKGVVEKQVSKLRIKRGVDQSSAEALDKRICELRERGAYLLTAAGTKVFRALA